MCRFAKFLNKQFKVKNDEMGVPSIILVGKVERSLVLSIDRKSMLFSMIDFLEVKLVLPNDMAVKEATSYIDLKYKEYKDFVMKL